MAEINIDYIGVVRQKSNASGLEYVQVDIPQRFGNLVGELNDMDENPNRTVLDLQDLFTRKIPRDGSPRYFSYCIPKPYYFPYVEGPSYPNLLTYNEYKDEMNKYSSEKEKKLICKYGQRTSDNGLKIKEDLEKAVKNKEKSIKTEFCSKAARYAKTYLYHLALKELKNDSNNIMFSSENIGWTEYKYNINSDLVFIVRSNFGYGQSSYFYVNLKYKGIDILPYTDVVKYYYANMEDLIHYTRSYTAHRTSWDLALSFVADTANEAISDESEFVKNWVMNEVKEMVSGLSRLESNPSDFYNTTSRVKHEIGHYVSVRNINSYEEKLYKIYPAETIVAYQAEKISGALLLLDNLSAFTAIYPEIEASIERIKEMNQGLLPKFKSTIQAIGNELKRQEETVERLRKKLDELNVRKQKHEEAIEKITQRERKKKDGLSWYAISCDYESKHADYRKLLDRIDDLETDISDMEYDINERNRFASRISECIDRIEEYVTNVA